jgi:hypothetical protein
MTEYRIQEGHLAIPEAFLDNTTNVFTLGPTPQANMSITISRDRLDDGEDLSAYVKRQIPLLKNRLKGYKILDKCPIDIGPTPLHGQLIKATMPSQTQGRLLHLQQASVAFTDGPLRGTVLVFTLTTAHPASEEEQAIWHKLLSSFTPTQEHQDV